MSIWRPPGLTIKPAGGAAPYHASAVHSDNAFLENATWNPIATTNVYSYSWWFKIAAQAATFQQVFASNQVGSAENYGAVNDPNAGYDLELNFADSTYNSFLQYDIDPGTIAADTWHHVLVSVQTNLSAGNKKLAVYVDRVRQTGTVIDGSPSFVMNFNNVTMSVMGYDALTFVGNFADMWFAPGVSLLDGSGAIPVATLNQFIDVSGKPANPTGFPAGGSILLSGNKDTFPVNQLSGGAFTLTGTLTNASTSPSD